MLTREQRRYLRGLYVQSNILVRENKLSLVMNVEGWGEDQLQHGNSLSYCTLPRMRCYVTILCFRRRSSSQFPFPKYTSVR
jgi:hypothetical protein